MKLMLAAILLIMPSLASGQLVINTGSVASTAPAPVVIAIAPTVIHVDNVNVRPIVIGNSPNFTCPGCEAAKRWKGLPFDIVWRVNMDIGKIANGVSWPLFQFPAKDGKVRNTWACNQKQLLTQWTLDAETDPTKYAELCSQILGRKVSAPSFKAPKPTAGRELICGCGGKVAGCCICLKENQSGARAKPCTCAKNKGSVHLVGQNYLITGEAFGATGEYSHFNAVTGKSTREIPNANNLPPEAQPTPHAEIHRVLKLLNLNPNKKFIEYGCGYDARWAITAASVYGCEAVGIEIDHERAESAKRHVEMMGLSGKVTIIEGDATDIDIQADVGVAYLWPEVLSELKIQNHEAFASYQHQVPGLSMTKNGDTYLWNKPRQVAKKASFVSFAVWNNRRYSRPVCNSGSCSMCNSIRRQLSVR